MTHHEYEDTLDAPPVIGSWARGEHLRIFTGIATRPETPAGDGEYWRIYGVCFRGRHYQVTDFELQTRSRSLGRNVVRSNVQDEGPCDGHSCSQFDDESINCLHDTTIYHLKARYDVASRQDRLAAKGNLNSWDFVRMFFVMFVIMVLYTVLSHQTR